MSVFLIRSFSFVFAILDSTFFVSCATSMFNDGAKVHNFSYMSIHKALKCIDIILKYANTYNEA